MLSESKDAVIRENVPEVKTRRRRKESGMVKQAELQGVIRELRGEK